MKAPAKHLSVEGCSAIVSLASLMAIGKLSYCLSFSVAHGDFAANALVLSAAACGKADTFLEGERKLQYEIFPGRTSNLRLLSFCDLQDPLCLAMPEIRVA